MISDNLFAALPGDLAPSSEAHVPAPGSHFLGSVASVEESDLSEPQFLHLQTGNKSIACMTGLPGPAG